MQPAPMRRGTAAAPAKAAAGPRPAAGGGEAPGSFRIPGPSHEIAKTLSECRRGSDAFERNGSGQRRERHPSLSADTNQHLRFADADQYDALSRAYAELIDDGDLT